MLEIYKAVFESSNELEFITKLAEGPLKEAFDDLQGQPIKDYPPQKQPDGSVAITISQKLVGRQHPEYDRTGLGLLQLYNVLRNNKNTFPGLSESKFAIIQQYVHKAIKYDDKMDVECSADEEITKDNVDGDKLAALVVLLGIHDLAKIVDFEKKARLAAEELNFNLDIKEHDEISWEILTSKNQQLIEKLYPSYASLNEKQKNLVLGALAGGINPGRVYQLEATPGEFALVTKHGNIDFDPAMYAAFHILDMGSIRGNFYVVDGSPLLNTNGKRADAFWNDVTISFMPQILELAGNVVSGSMAPVEAYNAVVNSRATQFKLNASTPVGYAATRICAMISSRFANFDINNEEHVLLVNNYLSDNDSVEDAWKNNLIEELNTSGYDGKPSICVGYAPDIAAKIYQGMKEDKSNTLKIMLNVFAKSLNNFFIAGRESINSNEILKSQTGQITIEAEKLHPLMTGESCKAIYNQTPILTWSAGGFVASLPFSFARSGSPTFGKLKEGEMVKDDKVLQPQTTASIK